MDFSTQCDCLNCIKQSPIFQYLTEDELKGFNENRYEVKFKPGEMIFKQGAPVTHMMSFTKGLAKLYIEGLNRKNLLLKVVKPGDFIGGPGLNVDNLHHYSIRALVESEACFIDLKVVNNALQNNKDFAYHRLRSINETILNRFDRFVSLTQKHMPGRVADAIIYLHTVVYKTNPFHCDLSRQDLADMVSLSKESTIRILREFKDSGIIRLVGDDFNILDMDKLVNISHFG